MPLDTGPNAYPAGQQGDLIGACEGNGASGQECECELKLMEAAIPAGQVGDSQDAGATMAAEAKQLKQEKPHAFDGGCP